MAYRLAGGEFPLNVKHPGHQVLMIIRHMQFVIICLLTVIVKLNNHYNMFWWIEIIIIIQYVPFY